VSLRAGMPQRQVRRQNPTDRIPSSWRARLTPVRVMILVALGGSLLFVLWGLVDRGPTQVPVLVSGLAIVGLVFGALAEAGAIETYRAARGGEGARSFWAALLGGLAGIVAFVCLAAAAGLTLMWRGT
jgi:hypothetical protein